MQVEYKEDLKETAGVTIKHGKIYLYINKAKFEELTLEERKGALEHEVNHLIDFHPIRMRERDAEIWSFACDLAVNSYIPDLPPNQVLPDKLKFPDDLAAEEYYLKLDERAAQLQLTLKKMANHLKGQFKLDINPDEIHSTWNDPEADDEKMAEAVILEIIKDAFNKNAGSLPGHLIRKIESLLKSQIEWKQALRRITASARTTRSVSTWKRPNRRGFEFTPGKKKERTLKIALVIDTSMSTTGYLSEFKAEMKGIKDTGAEIEVMEVDVQIQNRYPFDQDFNPEFKGGGGTSFFPPFEYYKNHKEFRPNFLIYLTDGHGEAPKEMTIPTLWVITPEGRKPADWGYMIQLPKTMQV